MRLADSLATQVGPLAALFAALASVAALFLCGLFPALRTARTNLALAMKVAAVRIVGPIPGRGTVAVEVPNPETATVYLREILVSQEFVATKGRLPLALGKDTTGNPVVADLAA